MKQMCGMLMKDWTILKGYLFLALLLDIIIPVGSLIIFPLKIDVFEGLLVYTGTVMAFHAFVPIVFLSILFTKEMDRPDIFFHSNASIFKLTGSKFLTVTVLNAISLSWASLLAISTVFLAPDSLDIKNLISWGAFFAVGILIASIQFSIVFYFFMALFYSMKPKVGGFAYIITMGLFLFSLEVWDRFKATDLYAAATNFWNIDFKESEFLTNIMQGLMITIETPSVLPLGQFVIFTILLLFLFLLATYWFEKKVRA